MIFRVFHTRLFHNKAHKTHTLGALLLTASATLSLPAYASVPIEQRSLSNTGATASVNNANPQENAQGSTLWQLYQQVQQLQQEVRELRGQLEDQQDTLGRTQKDLKNRYADLDQRLELLNQAQNSDENSNSDGSQPESGTTTPAIGEAPSAPEPAANTNGAGNQPASPAKTNTGSTGKAANTAPVAVPVATVNTNSTATNNSQSPDDAEKNAYVGAYEAYKSGGAIKAIRPMQAFINTYPNSVYVPNAYYWLGEFYLASDPVDFVKAKQSFLIVVSKYPKSAKASASLYRLATITKEIDHRPQEALTLMRKVIQDYPSSQEANFAKSFINTN